MAEVQENWKELGSKAEALGLKLKLHLEQEQDGSSDRESGDTKAMVDEFGKKLSDAFDSMGNAAKDPAVREDVKDMGRIFKDALLTTFSAVGAEMQHRSGAGSGAADDTESDDAATADTEAVAADSEAETGDSDA